MGNTGGAHASLGSGPDRAPPLLAGQIIFATGLGLTTLSATSGGVLSLVNLAVGELDLTLTEWVHSALLLFPDVLVVRGAVPSCPLCAAVVWPLCLDPWRGFLSGHPE